MKILVFIIIALNILVLIKRKRILSSASMWLFCYSLIYILTPIITTEEYPNESIIDIFSLVGVVSFSIGQLIGNKIKIKEKNKKNNNKIIEKYNIKLIVFLYILITVISAATLIATIGIGTAQRLITGSITSKQIALNNSSTGMTIFGILQNLQAALLIIMFLVPEKNKAKLILLALFLIQNIFFSFTRIFIVCVLIILVMHWTRNLKTKKQIFLISLLVIILSIFMVSMNYVRNLGLTGNYDAKEIFKIESIIEGTDFKYAYKYFDKLISKGSPHIVPYAYLKPLYVIIPREIWPDKPETLNIEILKKIDPEKANTGYSAATSVLGEGYAVLGTIGVAIYPLIWGLICSYQDKKYALYKNSNNYYYLSFYYIFSTLIVISGQRGDWSTYFVIIVWAYLLPMYIISKISGKRKLAKHE